MMAEPKRICESTRARVFGCTVGRKAFQAQIQQLGFSLVELISSCPTWWRMTPLEAFAHIEENMLPQYPLKIFVDKTEEDQS